jgi:hypothetical protein
MGDEAKVVELRQKDEERKERAMRCSKRIEAILEEEKCSLEASVTVTAYGNRFFINVKVKEEA